MRAFVGLFFIVALLSGCSTVPDEKYQSAGVHDRTCTLSQTGRRAQCPLEPTSPAEGEEARVERRFNVAYLEYCELESEACKGPGQLFAREQLDAILRHVRASNAAGESTLVAVYVHGWHHNAHPTDENVKYFDHMLARYKDALIRAGRGNTKVLGVYVGWRGESISSKPANLFTVASRGRAADAIAEGSIAFNLKEIADVMRGGPEANRMIVTGHSFGGRLVSRALHKQFLKSSLPLGEKTLIVTLNAAIGADAFYEFYQPGRRSPKVAKPTWVNITSLDDWATRYTYPIARIFSNMHPNVPDDDSSHSTIGHYRPYKTHQISFANCKSVGCGDEERMRQLSSVDYWSPAQFHFFVLPYAPESGGEATNMCGLIRQYPYNGTATKAMEDTGVCYNMVGSESPRTDRTEYPANGHLWNIEGDSTVIDTDGLQATSAPVHNAVTQTNLAPILVRLLYTEK